MKITKKILIISLLPLFVLLASSLVTKFQINEVRKTTRSFLNGISHRQAKLAKIYRTFGYGGAIHNFKNYVLRGDPSYYKKAKDKLTITETSIKDYLVQDDLPQIETRSLRAILQTVMEYKDRLSQARNLISKGLSAREIDQRVKVDDTLAEKSFIKIESNFLKMREKSIIKLQKTVDETDTLLNGVFAFTILFSFLSTRKTNSSILESIGEIRSITKQITDETKATEIDYRSIKDDELRKLAEYMIQMNKELKNTLIALRNSNENLKHFAFVASHDLQEPIHKIESFADLLEQVERDRLSSDSKIYLSKIKSTAVRMKGLIKSLLNYSKIGGQGISKVPVDLNEAVKTCLSELKEKIKETDAKIEIEKLPIVMADKALLGKVFTNLISNALKYCHEAPEIRVTSLSGPGQKALISVIDNGIGFDEKHTQKILMPFGRAHSRSQFPGNGIGLASCVKALDAHGSQLIVKSSKGQGSSFSFELPIA